jgi:quercetin dioxygenase-like cupin family protein
MAICRTGEACQVEMIPGLRRRTLVTGKSMMVCECTFDSGVQVPTHSHPHEQAGYIVSGKIRVIIDGESFDLAPGDSYCALSNVPHSALTFEPSVVIDVFSPPREDYR